MPFFEGAEFDWLERQIAGVIWTFSGPATRMKVDDLLGFAPQWAAAAKKPTAFLEYDPNKGLYDQNTGQWVVPPRGEYVDKATGKTIRNISAKTLTPPKQDMSVEEYNAWRGGHPARAASVPYVYQQYPLMLYRSGGAHCIVESAREHQRLLKDGWTEKP